MATRRDFLKGMSVLTLGSMVAPETAIAKTVKVSQKAKYVFYFIGDGMGVNPVNMTEIYRAELEGRIGVKPLLFTTFPYGTMATTYSVTSSITDSSAGGTALACGHKTYNGAVAVDADKNRLTTVAEKAKKAGRKVGIVTSVSIDHATPASFYAHQPDRGMYYEIANDLVKADFEFYAGAGFLKPQVDGKPNAYDIFKENGYTVAKGMAEYKEKAGSAKKMILRNYSGQSQESLKYAIDRQPGDLSLKELTESAIDFLMKGKDTGFFMMVEGGKIDWAGHSNDAATEIREIEDMDEALAVAYEFYKKHPKETLIVVSADHDTGGLGLATTQYALELKNFQYQKQSTDVLNDAIVNLAKSKDGDVSWDDVRALLSERMGFWDKVQLSWEQEQQLFKAYGEMFRAHTGKEEKTLYSKSSELAATAKRIMSQKALVGWSTSCHTAGYVPVFAVGAGAEQFCHKMDNLEIAPKICVAAGYKD